MRRPVLVISFLTLSAFLAQSQVIPTPEDSLVRKRDSLSKLVDRRARIQPYSRVVTGRYSQQRGLFSIDRLQDTVYFEIPNSILHRDIEVINRLVRGPGGTGAYSGEELDEHTIQFEKGPDSTVRVRYDLVISEADSGSNIYKSVAKSNLNPIVISFPIKAFTTDSSAVVIDVSKFLRDKTFVNSIDPNASTGSRALAKNVNIGGLKDFYIESIHAYPINIEIAISKNTDSKMEGMPPGTPVTLETNCSFVKLPERPMEQRIWDPRVGFFADQVYHFDDRQQKVEDRRFVLRWRLEPRDEDRAKWERGELVEPRKPIILYIDPGTPKQWQPYLIAGINDWQKAFEQAGFKNAIIGKPWPLDDTSMHLDDVRYSVVNYLPSPTENAYGPQVHDPRSGEIIQTHIGWYHNVMQLLHDWYLIQAGATDPRARKPVFDEELMGQLIRFVSSHEVGHTLGLSHNFGSSSQTPVDSLRSKHYLDAHGHTASIMDYARFNYVAQPEDNIPEYDLFPRIGEYDRWAIQWGYRRSSSADPAAEKRILRQLVTDSLAANARLWFGPQAEKSTDPRCQSEDLGDDAMKANTYGIRNLQRILPHLAEWTQAPGDLNENLDEMYQALKDQYFRYMQHVMKNIGGVYSTIRSDVDAKPVFAPVPSARQAEAVEFFQRELFTTPYWLMDQSVISRVSIPAQPDFIEDLQIKTINKLLDIDKINQLLANQRQFGAAAWGVDAYLAAIHDGIWKELHTGKAIDPYRRNLQKSYVGAIQDILSSNKPAVTETDASTICRADLIRLQQEIHAAIPLQKDALSREHLQDLEVRIKNTLEAKRTLQ
jgi:Met-zincin/Domain of unknown function (DUF5117)/Domain of unknown function (DUF5118)